MFERLAMRWSDSENYVDIALLAAAVTLVSILLVHHFVVFRVGGINLGGLIAVLLTSAGVSYPFVRYMLEEEEREFDERWTESRMLERHAHQLGLYLSFFLGVTVAFALATFLIPEQFFQVQLDVFRSIRGTATGNAAQLGVLGDIITNNLWVFALTFGLTFVLASGILFVLVWNASVLGIAIGSQAHSFLHVPWVTLFYVPHGTLEIGGYVLAGIAGSLLSYRVEADLFGEGDTAAKRQLTRDSLVLTGIGVLLILLGGVVEVFVAMPR